MSPTYYSQSYSIYGRLAIDQHVNHLFSIQTQTETVNFILNYSLERFNDDFYTNLINWLLGGFNIVEPFDTIQMEVIVNNAIV